MKGILRARWKKRKLLSLIGLAIAGWAEAVTLGPIQVDSYMGQPLSADIRLDGLTNAQVGQLRVALADNQEFKKRGIKRLPIHENLQFSVEPAGNGHRIVVRSSVGMTEPFVNFLVTVKGAGETVTREYAVFLDADPVAAVGGTAPVVLRALPPEPVATTAKADKAAQPKAVLRPASADTQGWGGQDGAGLKSSASPVPQADLAVLQNFSVNEIGQRTYGPVRAGETLFSIANAVKPDHLSTQQMMQKIFSANRKAFATKNINSLMAGFVLVIPEIGGSPREKIGSMGVPKSEGVAGADVPSLPVESKKLEPKQTAQEKPKVDNIAKLLVQPAGDEAMSVEAPTEAEAVVVDMPTDAVMPSAVEMLDVPAVVVENDGANDSANDAPAQSGAVLALEPVDSVPAYQEKTEDNAGVVLQAPVVNQDSATNTPVKQADAAVAPAKTEVAKVEPKTVETAKTAPVKTAPAKTAPVVVQEEEEAQILGLPLWQFAIAGATGLALLLGLIWFVLRQRKRNAIEPITEEDLLALEEEVAGQDAPLTSVAKDEPEVDDDFFAHYEKTHPPSETIAAETATDIDDDFFNSYEENLTDADNIASNFDSVFDHSLSDDDTILSLNAADDSVFSTGASEQQSALSNDFSNEFVSDDFLLDLENSFLDEETDQVNASVASTTSDAQEDVAFFETQIDSVKAPIHESRHQSAPEKADEAFDFDFDALFMEDPSQNESDAIDPDLVSSVSKEADKSHEEVDFDFNELEFEDLAPAENNALETETLQAAQVPSSDAQAADDELLDFGFGFDMPTENASEPSVQAVVETQVPSQQAERVEKAEEKQVDAQESSAFSFSISESQAAGIQLVEEEKAQASSKSQSVVIEEDDDMEINLELGTSFIATGNKARARTWLEEVLEKGTAEQIERAKALLEKIND